MFKRRNPLPFMQSLKEAIWPSMGYGRFFRYIKLRITRLSDSSHRIALGLAMGAAISFTPIVGTHIIQAVVITWLLRGNVVASVIGTLAGNPVTFPVMWSSAIVFGGYLFGLFGVPVSMTLPDEVSLLVLWEIFKNEPFRLFFPWVVGGYVLTFLSLPVFYLIFYNLVKGLKLAHVQARRAARKRRAHKTALEITGQKD